MQSSDVEQWDNAMLGSTWLLLTNILFYFVKLHMQDSALMDSYFKELLEYH